jgi:hypothetical protein
MTTRMFNGSTFTFASVSVPKLIGISYRIGGQWVDVSCPDDVNKLFELGQHELEIRLRFKKGGAGALTTGTKGTAAIVWTDGSTSTCPGTWQVGTIEQQGDFDGPITSTAELRPTVPDVS